MIPQQLHHMIVNLPLPLHVKIPNEFLYGEESKESTEAYVFAVTNIINRPLLFTVHTIDGAVVSRLPIDAFVPYTLDKLSDYGLAELQPWQALGKDIQAIQHEYLKDYSAICKIGTKQELGRYIMTFDSFTGGFSEDPEQHKTYNMIELQVGQYALLPNNHCLFTDTHFTKLDGEFPGYKRNSTYWKL